MKKKIREKEIHAKFFFRFLPLLLSIIIIVLLPLLLLLLFLVYPAKLPSTEWSWARARLSLAKVVHKSHARPLRQQNLADESSNSNNNKKKKAASIFFGDITRAVNLVFFSFFFWTYTHKDQMQ